MKKYVYKGIKNDIKFYNKLKQLQYKEDYPFHMPGHKRNLKIDSLLDAISKIDITEITGFDDLHHPEENDSRIDG